MASKYNTTQINVYGEFKRFITPERYDPIGFLAKGSQGIVCTGWDNDMNKKVVIKHARHPFSDVQYAKQLYREFVLSRIMKHRNVINLEFAYTPETSATNFKNIDEEFAQLSWHLQDSCLLKGIDWAFDLLNKELQNYGTSWNQKNFSLAQFNDLLHRMLTFDPANRISAEEALSLPLWNCLNGCSFYNPQKFIEEDIALPYAEEYGNDGSIEEWREPLFDQIHLLQNMAETDNNEKYIAF
uniref:Protein kinase domain-containing protein n=1 Tax=Panagrolaimus sp. ES5 TaxID=591445 RepID=A0AC34G603_9BILA